MFQQSNHNHGVKRSGSLSWEGDNHKVSKYKHLPGPSYECADKSTTATPSNVQTPVAPPADIRLNHNVFTPGVCQLLLLLL